MTLLQDINDALDTSTVFYFTEDIANMSLRSFPAVSTQWFGNPTIAGRRRNGIDVILLVGTYNKSGKEALIDEYLPQLIELLYVVPDCYPELLATNPLRNWSPTKGSKNSYNGVRVRCVSG